jgi:hypothetical protein
MKRYGRFHAVLLAALIFSALVAGAFDSPLDSNAIRDACLFGHRHDAVLDEFFASYIHSLPMPKTGPHIARVELETPYSQIVHRAFQAPVEYTPRQAEEDFRKQPEEIVIRVQIDMTDDYPAFWIEKTPHGDVAHQRAADFWRQFTIRVSQDRELKPKTLRGQINNMTGSRHFNSFEGAEVRLTFDAAKVASAPLVVEVLTPDGQDVQTDFDLNRMR